MPKPRHGRRRRHHHDKSLNKAWKEDCTIEKIQAARDAAYYAVYNERGERLPWDETRQSDARAKLNAILFCLGHDPAGDDVKGGNLFNMINKILVEADKFITDKCVEYLAFLIDLINQTQGLKSEQNASPGWIRSARKFLATLNGAREDFLKGCGRGDHGLAQGFLSDEMMDKDEIYRNLDISQKACILDIFPYLIRPLLFAKADLDGEAKHTLWTFARQVAWYVNFLTDGGVTSIVNTAEGIGPRLRVISGPDFVGEMNTIARELMRSVNGYISRVASPAPSAPGDGLALALPSAPTHEARAYTPHGAWRKHAPAPTGRSAEAIHIFDNHLWLAIKRKLAEKGVREVPTFLQFYFAYCETLKAFSGLRGLDPVKDLKKKKTLEAWQAWVKSFAGGGNHEVDFAMAMYIRAYLDLSTETKCKAGVPYLITVWDRDHCDVSNGVKSASGNKVFACAGLDKSDQAQRDLQVRLAALKK